MINFHSETDFILDFESEIRDWIQQSLTILKFNLGEINYIFCDDNYLLEINQQFLNHDTFTDIISFDYSDKETISGDIFISIDRVKENANTFDTDFNNELHRVLIHGILHFVGYNDKTDDEQKEMTKQEDKFLSLREF